MAKVLRNFSRTHEFWLLAAIVVLSIFLSLRTDTFLTAANISDVITANAYVGILCAALLVVLIAGGIDISFTATAAVAQYVALMIANAAPVGLVGTFLLAATIGASLGCVNAILIYKLRIKSIIATIALLNVYFGFLIFFSGGNWIYVFPDWFVEGINWFSYTDASNYTYSLNLQIISVVVAFALTWLLLNRSNIGRQIYAMGGNPDAAGRIGFNLFGLHLVVYGYLGLFAGVAAIVQAQLIQTVMPTSLVGRELDVLAAVVLGGASLTGGIGTVLGTILGVALLAIVQNGLVLLGVSSYWLQAVSGFVILVSMAITAVQLRRAASRLRRVTV